MAASAARLHFGVDFTDEAFYATLPYRFTLGDVPYVSDLGIAQNAGLLTTPVAFLWIRMTGDNDGLILVLRYTYLLLRLAIVGLGVMALWRRAPPSLSIAAPLLACSFVLFAIPTMSYNTLASSAVSAALYCVLIWAAVGSPVAVCVGLFSAAIAAYVHPGLALVATAVAIAFVVLAPTAERRRLAVRWLGVFAAVLAVAVIGVAAMLGWSHLQRLVAEAGALAGPSVVTPKLLGLPARLLKSGSGQVLLLLWSALWFADRLPRAFVAAFSAAYVIVAATQDNEFALIVLGGVALPLTWRVWRASGDSGLLVVAGLSVAAGLTVAQFSTNGVPNAAVGMEVAAVVGFVALHRVLVRPETGAKDAPPWLARTAAALAVFTACRFSAGQWTRVYGDDAIAMLSAMVESGPYKGLRTTPEKRAYLGRVQAALASHGGDSGSFLAFNKFPAAYLMVRVPPATPITWIDGSGGAFVRRRREGIARALHLAARPILVMQIMRFPLTVKSDARWTYASDDPIVRAVEADSPRLLLSTPDYLLFEIPAGRSLASPIAR